MRVYVALGQWRDDSEDDEGVVLEVFVNEQDAKKFKADEEESRWSRVSIRPMALRTGTLRNA